MMKLLHGLMLSGMLLSGPAWGDPGRGRGNADRHEDRDARQDRDKHGARARYFEDHDARVITEYYAPRRRALPPGLEKKYYRTGHLPPGWQKRMEPMPVVVERQLVPVPAGCRRGFIDGFAVVYSPADGLIIDVTAVFGR